jgi:hypothetical protein
MKVMECLNKYVIRYRKLNPEEEVKEMHVTYNLINGRSITLDIVFEPRTTRIIEIVADLSIDNEDIREIAELKWKLGFTHEMLEKKLPPLFAFHEENGYMIVAFLPSKTKITVRTQLRDILEGVQQVVFRPNYFLYKDMKDSYQYVPIHQCGMEFYTYTEFIKLPHIQKLKNQDKGLAYARYYRDLKTHALVCKDLDIPPTFIYGAGKLQGKVAFAEKDYVIEEIHIKRPVFLGRYEGKKVIYVTCHSHNVHQDMTCDFVLFCYLNDGMLEKQWVVYTNPATEITEGFNQEIINIIDREVSKDEIRVAEDNQPIVSSKSNGYYLIPTILDTEDHFAPI